MIDVVCGILRNGAGELLACRRPAGKHLGGLWEFPGGKVDPAESPERALVRELREELSVEVEVGESMRPVVWDYDRGTIRLLPFRCVILAGEVRPIEHEAIRWCRIEELAELEWAPADLPVLAELRARGT